jgi:hypothetical protein
MLLVGLVLLVRLPLLARNGKLREDEDEGWSAEGENAPFLAKCCKETPGDEMCYELKIGCRAIWEGDQAIIDEITDPKGSEMLCEAICDLEKFSWCKNEPEKKGLSTGAIVGIVIGVAVVVGVSVGLIVFFVVRKKQGVGAGSEATDQKP